MILAKEFEGELWIKAADHNQAVKQAVDAEREACAKVCEEAHWSLDDRNEYAAAIRARENALTKLNKAAEDNGEEL
jgi:hypothetical protein